MDCYLTLLRFLLQLFKLQKLVFKNSFEIESGDEFNYYLLLLIKQLAIDLKLQHL